MGLTNSSSATYISPDLIICDMRNAIVGMGLAASLLACKTDAEYKAEEKADHDRIEMLAGNEYQRVSSEIGIVNDLELKAAYEANVPEDIRNSQIQVARNLFWVLNETTRPGNYDSKKLSVGDFCANNMSEDFFGEAWKFDLAYKSSSDVVPQCIETGKIVLWNAAKEFYLPIDLFDGGFSSFSTYNPLWVAGQNREFEKVGLKKITPAFLCPDDVNPKTASYVANTIATLGSNLTTYVARNINVPKRHSLVFQDLDSMTTAFKDAPCVTVNVDKARYALNELLKK